MAFNLVVAATILWNAVYLDRALQLLQKEGIAIPEDIPPHVSALGWEHITITGTYHWNGGMAKTGPGEGSNVSGGTLSSF